MREDAILTSTLAAASRPAALAVVDLSLTPGEKGLGLVRRLRLRFPQLKLIVVGIHDEQAALAAGADGFVPRCAVATDLLAAFDAILAGRRCATAEASANRH